MRYFFTIAVAAGILFVFWIRWLDVWDEEDGKPKAARDRFWQICGSVSGTVLFLFVLALVLAMLV